MAKESKHISRIKYYKSTFATKSGQEVLFDLIMTHHILSPCFVKGDPYESALREGERNVVLRIASILKLDPIKIQEKIEEAKNREENEYE